MRTLTSTGCDPAWAERVLRRHGMPREEIAALLEADDPEVVGRFLELHRERLQEQLDEQLRMVDALELLLIDAV